MHVADNSHMRIRNPDTKHNKSLNTRTHMGTKITQNVTEMKRKSDDSLAYTKFLIIVTIHVTEDVPNKGKKKRKKGAKHLMQLVVSNK